MKKRVKIITTILCIILVIFLIILTAFPFLILNPQFNKHVDFKTVWDAKDFGLEAEQFFVKTKDGLNISAYEVKVTEPKAVIICLSGIQAPSVTAYFGHARLFKDNGYASILFDMRAHGKSDGEKICFGYKEYKDTKAIVEYIKQNPAYKNTPIIVMGLSMGASTAINSIGQIPEIDGLISLSAYSSFEEVFYYYMSKEAPKAISISAIPFIHLATFIKCGFDSRIKPKNQINKIGNRPALLIHSTDDSQVPFFNFNNILKNAPSHVETMIIQGDKHMILDDFTKPEEDKTYSDTIIKFLNKHFGERK